MEMMKLPSITLPPELCTNILSKLSAKSLVRFRCVSKLWRSLIDDPYFVTTHLTNLQNNIEKSRLLVLEPPEMINAKQKCTIHLDENFRQISSLGLDVTWQEHHQVVGYINGVVCMKKYRWDTHVCGVFLWNPSIRKLLELPLPRMAKSGSMAGDFDFAFGYNPIMNEYKVIAWLYTGRQYASLHFELYTLSKGSWEDMRIPNGPCIWSNTGPKAFHNGVTYWIGSEFKHAIHTPKGRYTHFVLFDAKHDAVNYIELPDCEDVIALEHRRFPVSLDQSIALMEIFGTHSYIWVMEEPGVTQSWKKQYSINLHLFYSFMCLKTSDELLFAAEHEGVKSYNIKTQETTVLANSYNDIPVFTDTYKESLVLLNQESST